MRIRTLVPALACLAAAPLAIAADGPSVKFDGFVDSIYGAASTDSDVAGISGSNSAFTYGVKLGVAATISEKVSAQFDIFTSDGTLIAKQAYGTWKITDDVSLKTGKFIGDIGWVAAYATGLYRVNAGPIVGLYSTDSVGADVIWAKDDLTVSFTVANGLFDGDEVDGVGQTDVGQGNEKYAYLADITYALADKKGSVNAELGYDTDVTGKGGDALHLALNTTLTLSDPLTLGGELIIQSFSAPDGSTADDTDKVGFLAMGNYKLGTSIPASVTGMVQYVSEDDGSTTDSTMEFAVALLTNPAGTDKLGLNFELYYAGNETEPETGDSVESTEIGGAAELLYVF